MLNQGSFTRDEWNHLLRLFNMMSFSKFSCCHFSNFLCDPIGRQSAMSKREREATPKPMILAKARPINLVSHSPLSATGNLPQDLRYRVNPENVDERQGSQTSTRKLVQTNQSPEVQYSHVRRQENAQNSDSWKQDEGRNLRTRLVQGNLYGQWRQEQSFITWSTQTTNTWRSSSRVCKKKLGITAGYSTFAPEASKTNVLIWRMFMSSSMKATLDLRPNLFANLEIYKKKKKLRGNSEFIQYHTEIDIGAFWRDSWCAYDLKAHLPLGRDRLCLMMVIQWTKAKVRVYSDSVLCMEKMWVNKEAITR